MEAWEEPRSVASMVIAMLEKMRTVVATPPEIILHPGVSPMGLFVIEEGECDVFTPDGEYEDTLAVLSVKNQTIHFLHIDSLGKLVKIRSIGEFIYEDDEYTLSLHAMEGETDGRQAPPAAVGAPSTTARHGPEAGGGPGVIQIVDWKLTIPVHQGVCLHCASHDAQ